MFLLYLATSNYYVSIVSCIHDVTASDYNVSIVSCIYAVCYIGLLRFYCILQICYVSVIA